MKGKVHKLTLAGILFAIIIVFQLLKNISPFISGPIINTVLVVAVIQLGLWWGIGFSIIVPISSMVFASASAMTTVVSLTNGVALPVIMIGNIILVLCAYFGYKCDNRMFILSLIVGAVLKWLFMWGCGELVIKPLFSANLGKSVALVNVIFSTLQLYSGLLSIILIFPVVKAIDKIK